MHEIRADAFFTRAKDASYRVIEGVAIIVSPRDATMLTLNVVGTRVWTLLGELTVAEIASALTEEFIVNEERAMSDTIAFLEVLRGKGLVVMASQGEVG